jgi:hypothetical protein
MKHPNPFSELTAVVTVADRLVWRVSSLSLERYDRNDYSVPTAYRHRPVLVRGYVDEVVIACGAEVIARHPRSYAREDFILDPLPYLPLLERKIGAVDQAAPCRAGTCPRRSPRLGPIVKSSCCPGFGCLMRPSKDGPITNHSCAAATGQHDPSHDEPEPAASRWNASRMSARRL